MLTPELFRLPQGYSEAKLQQQLERHYTPPRLRVKLYATNQENLLVSPTAIIASVMGGSISSPSILIPLTRRYRSGIPMPTVNNWIAELDRLQTERDDHLRTMQNLDPEARESLDELLGQYNS